MVSLYLVAYWPTLLLTLALPFAAGFFLLALTWFVVDLATDSGERPVSIEWPGGRRQVVAR